MKMNAHLLRCGVLSACLFVSMGTLAQTAAPAAAPESSPVEDASIYRLSPGDVIAAKFFFNPELNDEMQIRPDGHVSMQLIGEVNMGGRTVSDVVRELEQRYAREVKTPRVSLQIRSYAGQKVFVTGEVQKPGVVSLIGGLNVLSAVGEAGGIRQTGSKSVLLIRKGSDGQPVMRKLSLNAANQFAERLQPFDVVVVPPKAITRVDRFVDEYIRQVIPANLTAGFQYLYNRATNAVSVVPF